MLPAKVLPTVAALLLALGVGAGPALAVSEPSPAQMRAAIGQAKQSRNLWATVNVCAPRRKPHTVGVRAQMPALGFPTWLSMQIQVEYWNKTRRRFVSVAGSGATRLVHLGNVSAGLEQGGYDFVLPLHAGLLRGTVTFRWRRNGTLLLTQSRHTVAGHPRADQGVPAHYSAATCRVR
jgi:hypothetical protein